MREDRKAHKAVKDIVHHMSTNMDKYSQKGDKDFCGRGLKFEMKSLGNASLRRRSLNNVGVETQRGQVIKMIMKKQ